ncbi:MAG: pentapeptide repeat-containing protein [Candidatus Arcticimaribacter sp.]
MNTDLLRIELVEKSFEKIRQNKEDFALTFYDQLFIESPQLKPLFEQTNIPKQSEKLYGSLVLLVENIRNPEVLQSVLGPLGEKHKGYGAIEKHYPLVGSALIHTLAKYIDDEWTPEVEKAWVTTYGAVVDMMLIGIEHAQEVPEEEEIEKHEQNEFNTSSVEKIKMRPRKKLTYTQKVKLKDRNNLLTKMNRWFWRTPKWMIALYAASFFFLLSYTGQEVSMIQTFIDTLEPLSIFIAVLIFIKEQPERKRQFHYQAWSIIDGASGIENSQARIIALEDLCDDGVSLEEINLAGAKLNGIEMNGVNISRANLNKAQLINAELFYTNLNNINLSEADCTGVTLYRSNISFANLSKANCSSANFSKANMMFADLSQGNFSGANFVQANLKGVNFEGAYLSSANLKGAKVIIEDLKKALLTDAIMPDGSIHQ